MALNVREIARKNDWEPFRGGKRVGLRVLPNSTIASTGTQEICDCGS